MHVPTTEELINEAASVLESAKDRGVMITTAESCTGGLIAGYLTEVAGSSAVVDRGFVTYSNAAKAQMLGVPMALIETHGAVSEPVAKSMAEGALAHSNASIAISVTGVAGPSGGTEDKPVGTVHFGCATTTDETVHRHRLFAGYGRSEVRALTVLEAFDLLKLALTES